MAIVQQSSIRRLSFLLHVSLVVILHFIMSEVGVMATASDTGIPKHIANRNAEAVAEGDYPYFGKIKIDIHSRATHTLRQINRA